MKKILLTIMIISSLLVIQCRGRDANGNTDTNNTSASKSSTDSTRGRLNSDSIRDTTSRKY